MARLTKSELLRSVEHAFQAGGWSVLYLTKAGEHPARYRITKNGESSFTVKVFIWNISHGGGSARSASEYRIQITGINPMQFIPEVGGKTLILGYWQQEEVFAGFDVRFHSGLLGSSPSIQISEDALVSANQNRFSTHRKETGELTVAFQPDFIGTYAQNLEPLHDVGSIRTEVLVLSNMTKDPQAISDEVIELSFSEPRRYAITQTKRALRSLSFADRVLTAYGHQCAICGIQLRLIDGAHILPVSEASSTDETSNGVALCAIHHRAYDNSLLTFDENYKVHLNSERTQELKRSGREGKLKEFESALPAVIHLPPNQSDRPKREYVVAANLLRGWHL
ncbi:HNH endonuclease [Aestuariivirga litoralis]|uniref:HNH endonuclease n=1 Tax=Aestuariivirga litoralis TaxID=2650924 RepID=UPI0018C5DC13|nr:HNH endonuclease [Aestuariivirga litoralis]MBG1231394.1 HNH endonuclease [Aestuariivirga litoralis]